MFDSKKKNFNKGFNSLSSVKGIQELSSSKLSNIQGGVTHRRKEDWFHQFMRGFNRAFK